MFYANDTRTRNRYQKPVTENWYHFSDTVFSYQMKLEAKFLDYFSIQLSTQFILKQ